MSLVPYVHALGRGPGRARNLTEAVAERAMRLILSGAADPHATGALLMLMRYRGESPGEIAGFTRALRATLTALPQVDLDWPSYTAGRTRGLPWFLLSARLVAQTGARVLLHGWNTHQSDGADVRSALRFAGIAQATDPKDAAGLLDRDRIAYLPLESFAPGTLDLLRLRDVLGLRSCINTACRVLNPAGAPAAVQGVFHPPYRDLQQSAGILLDQKNLCVLKGGGGEFERHPAKDVTLFRLRAGHPCTDVMPSLLPEPRRLADNLLPWQALVDPWNGDLRDPFAVAVVTGTAAAALVALGHDPDTADAYAEQLWADRPISCPTEGALP